MQKGCECGCGKEPRKGRRFVHGHNKGHNKPHNIEAKLKIRAAQALWKSRPEYAEFVKRQQEKGKRSKTRFKVGHTPLLDGSNLKGLQAGGTHWNWKGGITPEVIRLRGTQKYIDWRNAIFKRDDFTCQVCKRRGGYVEADHFPKRFSDLFKNKDWETMWDINNGRTLCRDCHDKTKRKPEKSISNSLR